MGSEPGAHERSLIQLVGIGPLPPGFAEELAVRVSRRVAVPCRVCQTPGQTELRRVPGRDQVDADWLLGLLEARPLPPGAVAMGITALDLAIPIFTFVFGRARESGHAALVSAARLAPEFYGLAPDAALTLHRAVLEVLHELRPRGRPPSLPRCRLSDELRRLGGAGGRARCRLLPHLPADAARVAVSWAVRRSCP